MLLNGLWKFSFENGPETIVAVPNCFDTLEEYRYLRGKGCYRRTVECGGAVELSCGGCGLRAEFFWDGKSIGRELTAFAPVTLRFDAGQPGEHELKIVCDNTIEEIPESEFRRYYDFYGFGGIYRDIAIRELPEFTIDYVKVTTRDLARGVISLHVECSDARTPLAAAIDGGESVTLPGAGDYELTVADPAPWEPDSPVLHTLKLSGGTETKTVRFGLRTIAARDGKLFLNGKPLKLVGVNRHDVCPETGAAVPASLLRQDLVMLKREGFNCIRGSHYPQSETMLILADELGLLVWDESLGWENPVESLQCAEFCRRQQDCLRRMIRASVNHPSIVFWGFLNEAITNVKEARGAVAGMVAAIRAEDDSRPVTFATMFGDKDECLDLVDMISFNTYPAWYGGSNRFFEPEIVQKEIKRLIDYVRSRPDLKAKPVIISEIGAEAFIGDHSRRRWSEEYQAELNLCALNCTQQDERCSGILFWQFCNSPVDDNDRIMMRPKGYNGKGLVDEYRRPKLAWQVISAALKPQGTR